MSSMNVMFFFIFFYFPRDKTLASIQVRKKISGAIFAKLLKLESIFDLNIQ